MLSGDSVAGETDSTPTESVSNNAVPEGSVLDGVVLPIDDSELAQIVEGIEEKLAELRRLETVGISNPDRRALLTRMETVQRTLFGMSHSWIADLIAQHGLDDIDASVPLSLAVLMRISPTRAGHRIRYAEQFGKRTAITGERLEPALPATATAAEGGALDEDHQNIIRLFFKRLGSKIDTETRDNAEQQLAQGARDLPPDKFKVFANRLYDLLDPDGDLPPEQIAEQTFVRFGDQDENGLSKMHGVVDSELRAYMEAAFAKLAKPGMCNPADTQPVVDEPDTSTDNPAQATLFDDPDGPGDHGADDERDCGDRDGGGDRDGKGGDGGDGGDGGGRGEGGADDASSDSADDGDDHADGSGGEASRSESADSDNTTATANPTATATAKTAAELEAERRAARDHRGQGRRQHDALKVLLRQMLASGNLGQHRGLPVTAVITMTIKDLESATGHAVTATGSLIKMRDAIRMASHAHHCLAIFDDDGRALYLGRSKRLASPDQRMVLMAADRGCTHPGCTRPATWSQVHHINEWVNGGNTDIDSLTFGCDQHHALVGPNDTDWATTKAGPDHQYPGRTLWHAPSSVDPSRKGRINHYHHPHEYLDPERSGAPPA